MKSKIGTGSSYGSTTQRIEDKYRPKGIILESENELESYENSNLLGTYSEDDSHKLFQFSKVPLYFAFIICLIIVMVILSIKRHIW